MAIKKLTQEQQKLIAVAGAIFFVTFIVGKNFIYTPRAKETARLRQELSDGAQKIQIYKQAEQVNYQLAQLRGAVKRGTLVEFSREILNKLTSSKLEPATFAPRKESGPEGLARFVVEVELTCTYEEIAAFIGKLERVDNFIINIDTLNIERIEGGKGGATRAKASLILSTTCLSG